VVKGQQLIARELEGGGKVTSLESAAAERFRECAVGLLMPGRFAALRRAMQQACASVDPASFDSTA